MAAGRTEADRRPPTPLVEQYAYWQQNLATREVLMNQHGDEVFSAGSINKVPIAAGVISLIETGEIDPQQPVDIIWADYDQAQEGTGVLRYELKGAAATAAYPDQVLGQYSYKQLLELTLRESDNLAVFALANAVGRERIQGFLNEHGFRQITIRNADLGINNQTTAVEIGRLFSQLKRGGLLIKTSSAQSVTENLPSKTLAARGRPVTMNFKEGSYGEEDRTYYHLVGYLSHQTEQHAFAVLTSDHSPSLKITADQQQTAWDSVNWMAEQVAWPQIPEPQAPATRLSFVQPDRTYSTPAHRNLPQL